MKRLLILLLLAAAINALGKPWRNYEVYQPDLHKYRVLSSSERTGRLNNGSSIVWFKGGWYCFWNSRNEEFEKNNIYFSISRDLRGWSSPEKLFESDSSGMSPEPFVYGRSLWLFWKSSSGKLALSRFDEMAEPEATVYPEIEGFDKNSDITLQGRPYLVNAGVAGAHFLVLDKESRELLTAQTTDEGETWEKIGQIKPLPEGDFNAAIWRSGETKLSAFIKPRFKPEDPSCLYSESIDWGKHWSYPQKFPFDMVETPLTGFNQAESFEQSEKLTRNFIVTNDSRYKAGSQKITAHDNLAIFCKHGPNFDFEAGRTISRTDPFAFNPHCFIRGERLVVSYTSGVENQVIKAAVMQMPESEKYYIYPRSKGFPDTERPQKRDKYYHFSAAQRINTEDELEIDETGFAASAWVRTGRGGTILDCKSGQSGFIWKIENRRQVLVFPEVGEIESEVIEDLDQWQCLGARLDALEGKIIFYASGEKLSEKKYPKDKLGRLSGGAAKIGNSKFEAGFSGDLRILKLYSTPVEEKYISEMYKRHLWELKRKASRDKPIPESKKLILNMDPAEQELMEKFSLPEESNAGTVEYGTEAGRKFLYFNGESSAGLDFDYNTRKYGDYLQLEFTFKMLAEDETVLCSFGDRDVPVEVVARQNAVYMRFEGNDQVLGELKPQSWNTINIFTGGSISRAKMNNHSYRQISHNPIANWAYLGKGFPTGEQPRCGRFMVDISSVRSRILDSEL
ncbi:putative neuraminidase (sialidase) [Sedimentisphaera cyanobacteriorum]|uniref:Putative neuraminidase (Sialidase) n=1 Tax=Sedimentisphaera cyanobacteriorum TaxID=1940790 RepID=A0A1Q2HMH8_9BACT|nr:hypothetical protein [Sedimentisphaera cyanobacteriorum]AQQ08416.1 putative neuraminidase (sialidase) [Sedimentisphaera cyanobacteriorum]